MPAVVAPLAVEVLDGLVEVVGDALDGGGVSGSGEGDVGEFSAAAVEVDVGPVHGGALGAVDGGGIGVVEVFVVELVSPQHDRKVAVLEGDADRSGAGVDGGDGAALAGRPSSLGAGGEGDDLVAHGVTPPASSISRATESSSSFV